jgi:hypothetical protein
MIGAIEYWGKLNLAALVDGTGMFPISIPLLALAALSLYRNWKIVRAKLNPVLLTAALQIAFLFCITGIGAAFRTGDYSGGGNYSHAAARAVQVIFLGTFAVAGFGVWRFNAGRWFAFGLLGYVQLLVTTAFLVSAMSITGEWM